MKLIKKYTINTEMEIKTGLHIGGSSDSVEIGGVDNPVIRKSLDNIPYIPGSSIKGKIRCLLEQINGASDVGNIDAINEVFGFSDKDRGKPSKLIVRDAYLTDESKKILEESEYTDMPFTEVKSENRIDRVSGTASDPRRMERVPAGVKFDVEFVINVWDNEEDGQKSLNLIKEGLKALELDYLGGSGSRGYGKVAFNWEMIDNYKEKDMTKLLENEE